MKNILSLIFAGIVGGAITLAGFQWINNRHETTGALTGKARFVNNVNVPPVPGYPTDFADAAAKAIPSVVHIFSAESQQVASQRRRNYRTPFDDFFGGGMFGNLQDQIKEGTGSGVIISEDGYIVTNNHVVDFADDIEVTLSDNRKYKAKVVGTDPKTDLAVLKIEADRLPAIQKGDSDKSRVGEWVLAIGNPAIGYDKEGKPQELTSTVTAGIISAKGRDIDINEKTDAIESFIQTDAVVNPGNSGGALVDAQGRLIGINTAIATTNGRYQGYSFAIPVDLMSKVVDDIIQYGNYKRPYLGINIQELDGDLAKEMGLNISQGILIKEIIKGGSAEKAGLKMDDVITQVNGKDISTVPELQEVVGRSRNGEVLTVTVVRNNRTEKIPVTLKAI